MAVNLYRWVIHSSYTRSQFWEMELCTLNIWSRRDTNPAATGSTVSYRYDSFSASNGPLIKYVKLRFAHAPGMPGTFSPPLTTKETASWRSRAVMHVGIANSQWRGKRSRHSRSMRNPQFYVSGKRPILWNCHCDISRISLGISFLKLYLPFMDIGNSG